LAKVIWDDLFYSDYTKHTRVGFKNAFSVTETTNKAGKINVKFNYCVYKNETSECTVWVKLFINWTQITETWATATSTVDGKIKTQNFTTANEYPAWTIVKLEGSVQWSANSAYVENIELTTILTSGKTTNNMYNIYVNSVKYIWEKIIGKIYWVSEGNKFIGGIIRKKEEGSINNLTASGYLELNYNGEIFKIPYI